MRGRGPNDGPADEGQHRHHHVQELVGDEVSAVQVQQGPEQDEVHDAGHRDADDRSEAQGAPALAVPVRVTGQLQRGHGDQDVALDGEVRDEPAEPETETGLTGLVEHPASLDDQHQLQHQSGDRHGRREGVPRPSTLHGGERRRPVAVRCWGARGERVRPDRRRPGPAGLDTARAPVAGRPGRAARRARARLGMARPGAPGSAVRAGRRRPVDLPDDAVARGRVADGRPGRRAG